MNDKIIGQPTQIILAVERHQAVYAVCSLDDCQASHNEITFSQNSNFPTTKAGETINDRDYSKDEVAQGIVESYALHLEPLLLINTSPTSEGSPIIAVNGVVVSGNNRVMSLKLATQKYPEKYAEYVQYLQQQAHQFGIKEDINKIKKPVLVRIDYDAKILNTELLSKYNQSQMKGKSELDKAIELSKTLLTKIACSNDIPRLVALFDTLPQLFGDAKYSRLLFEKFVNCNILTTSEQKTYFSNGVFSNSGKTLVELTLLAMVLKPQVLALCTNAGVKNVTNKVISCLSFLMENKTLPQEYRLIDNIDECVKIAYRISIMDAPPNLRFKLLLESQNLFSNEQTTYSFKSLIFYIFLQELPLKHFKEAIKGYNFSADQTQNDSLFGDIVQTTPSQAFDYYFTQKVVDNAQTGIVAYIKKNIRPVRLSYLYQRAQERLTQLKNYKS